MTVRSSIKHTLQRWIYVAAFYSGIDALFYYLNRRRQIVIAYHNVVPDTLFDGSLHLGVSHSECVFERHLQIINQRWPASESPDGCLVTFDDGYANQCETAATILERYGRRGVFFVTLDLVLSQAPLWTDRCLMWFSYIPDGVYYLLDYRFEINDAASRLACWRVIWNHILDNYSCLETLVNSMDAAFAFDDLSIDPRLRALRFEGMTLDQLAYLVRKGHRIGAHSCRHDVLSRLLPAALDGDFARCESEMGRVFNCDFYSYPFGGPAEVTEREQDACRQSKFRRAFMNVDSLPSGTTTSEYALPRLSLPNTTDRYIIEGKLSGFERALKKMLSRWQFFPRKISHAQSPV
jgi:peptidoglycan/xylan/chitin deacetylase (PgdA/CDA1 family)